MRFYALLALLLLPLRGFAADAPKLEPGAKLRFEFPELAPTLLNLSKGDTHPPILTAELPVNYSAEGKFPLFVYLRGNEGGIGEDTGLARGVAGPKDFICVGVSLFKNQFDRTARGGGIMVVPEDFEVQSRSYRVMFQRLLDAVPNITPERSTLGGFSNGAHTTANLLAGEDPFIIAHFRQFFFMEGGFPPQLAKLLRHESLAHGRFLTLRGDAHGRPPPGFTPPPEVSAPESPAAIAAARKLDFTSLTMRGYGHEQPPEFLRVIGQWTRGEKLDEVPPKPAPTPTPSPVASPSPSASPGPQGVR